MLEDLDKYEAAAIIQDNSEATLAPAINKSIATIDFNTQAFYSHFILKLLNAYSIL